MTKTMKNQEYVNVSFNILEEDHDLAMFYISEHPFIGVEERMDEFIVTFKSEDWHEGMEFEILAELKSISDNVSLIDVEIIEEQNWNEEYEKSVETVIVNENIGIAPEWKEDELTTQIKILINPKMSFGTGSHESTRLISRLAEKVVQPGSFWIDAGTGTGVLAILGIMLGADNVFAFDNNEWSVDNAKENFMLNKVKDKIKIELMDIDDMELPKADGIFANLFRHLLMQSFAGFYQSLKDRQGDLLIAGILIFDFDEIKQKATDEGFVFIESISENEWVSAHFKAKGDSNE